MKSIRSTVRFRSYARSQDIVTSKVTEIVEAKVLLDLTDKVSNKVWQKTCDKIKNTVIHTLL